MALFHLTQQHNLPYQFFSNKTTLIGTCLYSNFLSNALCRTLSNALLESRKAPNTFLPYLAWYLIDSCKANNEWLVLLFFLNPNYKLSLPRYSSRTPSTTDSNNFDNTGESVIPLYTSVRVASPCLAFSNGIITP